MKMEKIFNKNRENFAQIQVILNNAFKTILVQKSSRIRTYNALAALTLLYGSENWAHRKKG
jgi:hypothetical protein